MFPWHRCRQRGSFELLVAQGMAKIADLIHFINVHIEKRATASQGESSFRSLLIMDLQKLLQREIGHHITVVTEDGFVFVEKILNVFQPPCPHRR